ncbi:hypothetical protein AB0F30_17140 [Streptomyces sp. NPDC029006]|uniref:hypothetical protein n=1 Tax=Streptomyces sp. NPDC029006 TaxID=3155467 RepID=UPI0033F57AF4
MVTSNIIRQVDTHSVRLALHGAATIDVGHHPDHPDEATVTELAIIYTTTSSSGSPTRTEVTSITYVLNHREHKTAFVHPHFLDQPDEWPDWVRALVTEHAPV